MTTGWEAPDDEALMALYVRARTVAARVAGAQAAPDIASEVLIRALTRWERVGGHAAPWVTVAAANLAIDSLRKRTPVLRTRTVVDPADASAERLDLANALRPLPRRQREALVLRYLVGLPDDEIAESLGVSVATIKTHLSRGLQALRTSMSVQELNHAT